MGHNYSSLQLTLTFKTHTKHAKMHEMYKLFIFVVVLSPVSVGWRWEVNNGAHLFQSTADIHIQTRTKHAEMHEMYKLFISLLWFSPQFQLGGGGESTMGHTYSSLRLTLTIKTHTKHAKTHEMYKLFIFAAVLSAAAKLRRLALCVYL